MKSYSHLRCFYIVFLYNVSFPVSYNNFKKGNGDGFSSVFLLRKTTLTRFNAFISPQ